MVTFSKDVQIMCKYHKTIAVEASGPRVGRPLMSFLALIGAALVSAELTRRGAGTITALITLMLTGLAAGTMPAQKQANWEVSQCSPALVIKTWLKTVARASMQQ